MYICVYLFKLSLACVRRIKNVHLRIDIILNFFFSKNLRKPIYIYISYPPLSLLFFGVPCTRSLYTHVHFELPWFDSMDNRTRSVVPTTLSSLNINVVTPSETIGSNVKSPKSSYFLELLIILLLLLLFLSSFVLFNGLLMLCFG